jgi:peptidyl-tRNA hydrolase, PTH1 family
MNNQPLDIKAIIGLGNPGPRYYHTRHNIGFRILDALAEKHHLSWHTKGPMEVAELSFNGKKILLVKPQTFMNDSGKVIPALLKQGIKPENILVVHDELEQPFGTIKTRVGGSAKGHNGLKSLIAACGDLFARIRFGISRPEVREEVANYVLEKFSENADELDELIGKAVDMVEEII